MSRNRTPDPAGVMASAGTPSGVCRPETAKCPTLRTQGQKVLRQRLSPPQPEPLPLPLKGRSKQVGLDVPDQPWPWAEQGQEPTKSTSRNGCGREFGKTACRDSPVVQHGRTDAPFRHYAAQREKQLVRVQRMASSGAFRQKLSGSSWCVRAPHKGRSQTVDPSRRKDLERVAEGSVRIATWTTLLRAFQR